MIAEYKCPKCHTIIEYNKPYGVEDFPKYQTCECGEPAKRSYSKVSLPGIMIPDDFRAVNT